MRKRLVEAFRRIRRRSPASAPDESELANLTPEDQRIVERAWPHTMTSVNRLSALIDAVRYCVRRGVPGALAECGVWLGGSVLVMALTLRELGVTDRDIFLYDTFEGMTRPTERDVSRFDAPALDGWDEHSQRMTGPWWTPYFGPGSLSEEATRDVVLSSGYPGERFRFVRGAVEETLPRNAPDSLALLRLDTDWYESTRQELIHLYPRLSKGGVLIVDDYGHWEGCRQAVDEYFESEAPAVLLHRIDYTARIAVKH